MKVAIIGAGLAGLACAHELKRHGIIPVIFEKKGYIGEVLEIPAIDLNIFNTVIKDPIKYLRKKYNIIVTPHYEITEIVINSPNKTYTINGKIGYIFLRGREKGYLTTQLKESVDLPVTLNTIANVDELKKQFDHVLIATGTLEIPLQMNTATVQFDSFIRCATVHGNFKTNSVTIWMNTKYAKHGYAYLVPKYANVAELILIVDNIKQSELDFYWNEFLSTENINYPIVEMKEIRHTVGSVHPIRTGNLFFAGNAGGFLDSLLGFGSLAAMLSGAKAAECMVKGLDYNEEMKEFTKDVKNKFELRKVYNSFNNDAMDMFATIENLPVVKQFVFNNPLFKVTHGTVFARTYNKFK